LKDGRTPLHFAANSGHLDCIDLLVKAGAQLEANTDGRYTALMWACYHGHLDCVSLLVKAGAQLVTKDGITARAFAVMLKTNPQSEAIVKLLDEHAVRT